MPTGVAYVIVAPHTFKSFDCVIFAGQTIAGFSVSSTVTSKLQLEVLLLASVTSYVTVVVPIGNTVPLACPAVNAVTGPAQLSVPTGVAYVIVAPHTPASLFWVISAGQVIDGFCVSFTVTVNEQVLVFVLASVT